jgi:hypothetical protein
MPTIKINPTRRIYIDNEEFLELIKGYKKQIPPRIISEELGEMFKKIADNVAYDRKFINYTDEWKNEMKSDALFNCCRYIDTFDPNKSKNPFAYFTMVIINAFKMRIKKEKFQLQKDRVIKEEIYNEFLDEYKLHERKRTDSTSSDVEDMEDFLWADADNFDPIGEDINLNLNEEDIPPSMEDDTTVELKEEEGGEEGEICDNK